MTEPSIRVTKLAALKQSTVKHLFRLHPRYRRIHTFLETGTFKARTITNMLGLFRVLHTIELSKPLFERAVKKYGHLKINFHLGDSSVLLPEIAKKVNGPIFFYLDAHGFDRSDVVEGFPLPAELDYIKTRSQADVIAIDDVHLFGAAPLEGSKRDPRWLSITEQAIRQQLGESRNKNIVIIENTLFVFRRPVK